MPFIQNIHKLHHIKMLISQNDKYSMVLGPASLYLLSVQSYKEWLFSKTNGKQICVARINTFANILMFILCELKDILVYLQKNYLYEQHRNYYSILHIFVIEAWKKMYFVELIFAMWASYGKNAEVIFVMTMF